MNHFNFTSGGERKMPFGYDGILNVRLIFALFVSISLTTAVTPTIAQQPSDEAERILELEEKILALEKALENADAEIQTLRAGYTNLASGLLGQLEPFGIQIPTDTTRIQIPTENVTNMRKVPVCRKSAPKNNGDDNLCKYNSLHKGFCISCTELDTSDDRYVAYCKCD